MSASGRPSKPGQEFARAVSRREIYFVKNKIAPAASGWCSARAWARSRMNSSPPCEFLIQDPGISALDGRGARRLLVIGRVADVPVAVMQGRVHLYEGYSTKEVVFPMRVLGRMGIRSVILTNAAGAINLEYQPGCARHDS